MQNKDITRDIIWVFEKHYDKLSIVIWYGK